LAQAAHRANTQRKAEGRARAVVLECTMSKERVEHFLEDLRLADEDRFQLVSRLRSLILSVDPKITEEIKYGGILFSAGPPFCGIFSYTKHVSLEFGRGAELPDKHRVLEGEGKLRRHIKLESGQDLFRKNVREYVSLSHAAAGASMGKFRSEKKRT
jgi:hypothetical protein